MKWLELPSALLCPSSGLPQRPHGVLCAWRPSLRPLSQDPVPLSSPPTIALTLRTAVYYSIAVSAVEGPLGCFKVGPVIDKADMDILLGTFGETGL